MQTPTTDTLRILYEQTNGGGFREEHHNVGNLLDFIRKQIAELQQAEETLIWLMRDDQVTISTLIGPAMNRLTTEIAEACLAEARESVAS